MISFLFIENLVAATVVGVKNKKVLIKLENLTVFVGSRLETFDLEDVKTSVLEVKKIGLNKAIAEIVEGAPNIDDEVKLLDSVSIKTKNKDNIKGVFIGGGYNFATEISGKLKENNREIDYTWKAHGAPQVYLGYISSEPDAFGYYLSLFFEAERKFRDLTLSNGKSFEIVKKTTMSGVELNLTYQQESEVPYLVYLGVGNSSASKDFGSFVGGQLGVVVKPIPNMLSDLCYRVRVAQGNIDGVVATENLSGFILRFAYLFE